MRAFLHAIYQRKFYLLLAWQNTVSMAHTYPSKMFFHVPIHISIHPSSPAKPRTSTRETASRRGESSFYENASWIYISRDKLRWGVLPFFLLRLRCGAVRIMIMMLLPSSPSPSPILVISSVCH